MECGWGAQMIYTYFPASKRRCTHTYFRRHANEANHYQRTAAAQLKDADNACCAIRAVMDFAASLYKVRPQMVGKAAAQT